MPLVAIEHFKIVVEAHFSIPYQAQGIIEIQALPHMEKRKSIGKSQVSFRREHSTVHSAQEREGEGVKPGGGSEKERVQILKAKREKHIHTL